MHGEHGIGRDLAGRGAEKQIGAGRIAHRVAGCEFGFNLAACHLDLEAGRIDLGSSTAQAVAMVRPIRAKAFLLRSRRAIA